MQHSFQLNQSVSRSLHTVYSDTVTEEKCLQVITFCSENWSSGSLTHNNRELSGKQINHIFYKSLHFSDTASGRMESTPFCLSSVFLLCKHFFTLTLRSYKIHIFNNASHILPEEAPGQGTCFILEQTSKLCYSQAQSRHAMMHLLTPMPKHIHHKPKRNQL